MDLAAQDGHVVEPVASLEFAWLDHADIPALLPRLERHPPTSSRR